MGCVQSALLRPRRDRRDTQGPPVIEGSSPPLAHHHLAIGNANFGANNGTFNQFFHGHLGEEPSAPAHIVQNPELPYRIETYCHVPAHLPPTVVGGDTEQTSEDHSLGSPALVSSVLGLEPPGDSHVGEDILHGVGNEELTSVTPSGKHRRSSISKYNGSEIRESYEQVAQIEEASSQERHKVDAMDATSPDNEDPSNVEETREAARERQIDHERTEWDRRQELQLDEYEGKVAEDAMRNAQGFAAEKRLVDSAEDYEGKSAEKIAWLREVDKRYNEVVRMQVMARHRAAVMRRKELEISSRETELIRKEAQLRGLEDELKRKEQGGVFEEEKRKIEEKMGRLLSMEREEAREELLALEQAQETDKERLECLVSQQGKELEDLKHELIAENEENAHVESNGLVSYLGEDEPRMIEFAAQPFEGGDEAGKRVKAKKGKENMGRKTLVRKDRQDAMELRRFEQGQRDNEAREEQRQREEKSGSNGQHKSGSPRPQAQEDGLPPTVHELEERRKQDAQEGHGAERAKAEVEREQREAAEMERRDKVQRETQEAEAMKRAREAMYAEEMFRREQDAKSHDEEEERRSEEESRGARQAGHRKMDEGIRRKQQNSGGGIESAWSTSSGFSSRSPPPVRNVAALFREERPAPAWTSWGTTPSPKYPDSVWSTNMAESTPTAGFPPRDSTTVPNNSRSGYTKSADQHWHEWQRKQEEFSRQQWEQYKQMQSRAQTSS